MRSTFASDLLRRASANGAAVTIDDLIADAIASTAATVISPGIAAVDGSASLPVVGTNTGSDATAGIETAPGLPGLGDAGLADVEVAAAAAGYNAATDTAQWNIKAIFGADPNAVLKQFNGKGVHIGIFDDGIDKTQVALKSAYDASREVVINGVKMDPSTTAAGATSSTGIHGTAVAGIIAADASTNGGTLTGLAYGSTFTTVNVFNGYLLSEIGQMYKFDVTNNSYGWTSKWVDPLFGYIGKTEWAAYKLAVESGRGGLGTVIVAAAGNSWSSGTQTGHTEMGSTRWVIDVGAVTSNGDIASYSTRGSNVLVSAPTDIATTDRTGAAGYTSSDYVYGFNGTSAAAPEVTALVADMLSADAKLGWRDVEKILAITAHDTQVAGAAKFTTAATGSMAYGWQVNHAAYDTVDGGGLHFSNDYGFGQIDGHAAIREAEVWHYFSAYETSKNEMDVHVAGATSAVLTGGKVATFALDVTTAEEVENAALSLKITSGNFDGLKIELISPTGTDSVLLSPSSGTQTGTNVTWSLASHAFLGESAIGTWTVKVTDTGASDTATISAVTLDLYGSAPSSTHVFHYTDGVFAMDAYDATRLTLHDRAGVGDWIDTAPMTGGTEVLDLITGHTSTMNGKAFVTIGTDTLINNATVADGIATVIGNDAANIVVAGHGTDTISAGAGADTIYAGYGALTATGGAGADMFAFNHTTFGTATITDFQKGVDHIDLRGLGDTFSTLKIVDTGTTIKITVDGVGDVITLANTNNQHLTATDFLFA